MELQALSKADLDRENERVDGLTRRLMLSAWQGFPLMIVPRGKLGFDPLIRLGITMQSVDEVGLPVSSAA